MSQQVESNLSTTTFIIDQLYKKYSRCRSPPNCFGCLLLIHSDLSPQHDAVTTMETLASSPDLVKRFLPTVSTALLPALASAVERAGEDSELCFRCLELMLEMTALVVKAEGACGVLWIREVGELTCSPGV